MTPIDIQQKNLFNIKIAYRQKKCTQTETKSYLNITKQKLLPYDIQKMYLFNIEIMYSYNRVKNVYI